MVNWKQIWNNRKFSQDDELLLEKLIKMDGFDSGAGRISLESWEKYIDFISKKIVYKNQVSIYEVGCGSGPFLYKFYNMGHVIGGIDYSKSMIEIAQLIMPNMDFQVGDAMELDITKKYNVLISNSVFQYFPDYEYAKEIILKMMQKSNKVVAILDINDIQFKDYSESIRKAALSEEEYRKKYEGLNHLYYDRNWFINLAREKGYKIDIFNQNISNYENNSFRFNIVMEKSND